MIRIVAEALDCTLPFHYTLLRNMLAALVHTDTLAYRTKGIFIVSLALFAVRWILCSILCGTVGTFLVILCGTLYPWASFAVSFAVSCAAPRGLCGMQYHWHLCCIAGILVHAVSFFAAPGASFAVSFVVQALGGRTLWWHTLQ